MDLGLKILMFFVFVSLGLISFIMTDLISKLWGNTLIAHEGTLRKVPFFGMFTRSFIFWFEKGSGDMLVRFMGAVCIFLGLLVFVIF